MEKVVFCDVEREFRCDHIVFIYREKVLLQVVYERIMTIFNFRLRLKHVSLREVNEIDLEVVVPQTTG